MNLKEQIKGSGTGWAALVLVLIVIVVMVATSITQNNKVTCKVFKEQGTKILLKYLEDKLGRARRNIIEIVEINSIEKMNTGDFIKCTMVYTMEKDFDSTSYTMSHTATASRLDNNEGWLLSFSKHYTFSEF